jgi:hypothetical protein
MLVRVALLLCLSLSWLHSFVFVSDGSSSSSSALVCVSRCKALAYADGYID